MLTSGINFVNFKTSIKIKSLKKKFTSLINENNEIIKSLSKNYKDSYKKNNIIKYKKNSEFRVIGIGGSSLGIQAIYNFLKHKVKNKFIFIDNLISEKKKYKKKKFTNLIISKSGNTIETIVNSNILIKNTDKNVFITENKKNY